MDKTFKILGFAGSLRKDSYNKALLRAARELVPKGVELETFDLAGMPLFNADFENQPAEKVKEFKAQIRAANAVLSRVGSTASEEVILQLIKSKCVPILLYGTESVDVSTRELSALDFIFNRFVMKVFKCGNASVCAKSCLSCVWQHLAN